MYCLRCAHSSAKFFFRFIISPLWFYRDSPPFRSETCTRAHGADREKGKEKERREILATYNRKTIKRTK